MAHAAPPHVRNTPPRASLLGAPTPPLLGAPTSPLLGAPTSPLLGAPTALLRSAPTAPLRATPTAQLRLARRVLSVVRVALLPLAVAATVTASPAAAQAQPAQSGSKEKEKEKEAARVLAQLGYELFTDGKYEEAAAKLDQAESIFHAPTHLELAGRALEKLGRLLAARDHYKRAVVDPPTPRSSKGFQQSYAEAKKELAALLPRIPSLQVKLTGHHAEKARVTLDGKAIPASDLASPKDLDPGTYTLRVEAEGAETEVRVVTLAEGAHQTLELSLAPSAAARGPLAPAILGLGAGAAGIALGAVAGALSLGAVDDLNKACPDKRCPGTQAAALDQAKTLSTVSTIGFAAGGVLAAAGVVLLVVRPGGAKAASGRWVAPTIGALHVGLEGVF
jgi:tetratricopeptide (TPR) repeat protein